jgi:hypothetical protein
MLIDWSAFNLTVFDVDGTLYSLRKLRLKMASVLVRHCLINGSMNTIRILGSYREWREELAEQGNERFEEILVSRLASHYRKSDADIQAIVTEWMEVRPLKYLKDCRYAGVKELVTQLVLRGVIGKHANDRSSLKPISSSARETNRWPRSSRILPVCNISWLCRGRSGGDGYDWRPGRTGRRDGSPRCTENLLAK